MLGKSLRREASVCLLLALGLVMGLVVFAVEVKAVGRTYTVDIDFDEGVLFKVNHDSPNNDQLQLSLVTTTFPFIWVANSGEDTVSKIDTVTGVELGRYRTGPGDENPSRTTVDLNGDVWVGNRNSDTAVKIALNPPGPNTSTGPGDVLPYGTDDAVLLRIPVDTGPRALAVDANNNVWIGGTGGNMGYYDGMTGASLDNIPIGMICYGALVDGSGTLWISNQINGVLTRVDDPNGLQTVTPISTPLGGWVYGIGIDASGYIYTSGWVNNMFRKLDPSTNTWLYNFPIPGGGNGRGVAVGADGDVWVANSGTDVVTRHNPATGMVVATIPVGLQPTGVAMDAAGKIWVTNLDSNDVMRIDPATNAVDFTQGSHPGPYNYSDMTGVISQTITSRIGTWTVIYDSGVVDAPCGTISWNDELQGPGPPGTSITVRARSSSDGSTWSGWESATNGVPLSSTLTGQYIEIEATLQIIEGDVSPVLYDLTVELALINVAIDIKPQSCPNPLNVGKNGVLPVAILGTADFDVTTVDPASVKLEGVSPLRWDLEDVATPADPLPEEPGAYDCTTEGPDGFMDLTLKFNAREVAMALGDVEDGDIMLLSVIGNLMEEFGGIEIRGVDVIIILKKGKPAEFAPASVATAAFGAYPVPFNPEVWMPYRLGQGVAVKITVYSASGQSIRTLDLGYRPAGDYVDKSKAAHWDGRNEAGEQVSSGVYFYTIQAGDFAATKKMVVAR